MRARPVIAIDGPVGAGKSTVARALAAAMGFTYVNTGAMYRGVAIAAREAGIGPQDFEENETSGKLRQLLESITVGLEGDRVLLNGRDVSFAISDPEIGNLASQLSALQMVREKMRALQRAAGEAGGVVMEGRDIGTVIFPDAEIKFFLDADVAVRAQRRYNELTAKGIPATQETVRMQLVERDARDRDRALAPLIAAPDATRVDSSNLDVEQVVARMLAAIKQARRIAQGLKQ